MNEIEIDLIIQKALAFKKYLKFCAKLDLAPDDNLVNTIDKANIEQLKSIIRIIEVNE